MGNKRALHTFMNILLVLVLAGSLLSFAGHAQAREQQKEPEGKPAPVATVNGIIISFKLDPRLSNPTYGQKDPWISPTTYRGANAQDTVEARAQMIDARGKLTKTSAEWIPSDPEMVTVSPSQGNQVKIVVKGAGESKLKVAAQGFSKEFVVRAKYAGKFIQVEIAQPATGKSDGAAAAQDAPALKGQKERISYAAGLDLAQSLRKQSVDVDPDLMILGLKDGLSGGKTLMTEQEVKATLIGVQTELKSLQAALQKKEVDEVAEKNKKRGEAFLAENGKKEGVVSLPSGLQYKIIKVGEGKKPTAEDTVVCQYRGTLIDGTEFDNSYRRKAPLSFPLKAAIKGWAEALQLMPAGSKWQLFIPPDLAYGERGLGLRTRKRSGQVIESNATLIFEVELVSIRDTTAARSPVATR